MNSKGGGLAVSLVLVLSGCTGADGLPGSQQVGDGSQTPVVGTTGASPSGTTGDPVAADVEPESGLYRVDPATGRQSCSSPLRGNCVSRSAHPKAQRSCTRAREGAGSHRSSCSRDGEARKLTHLPGGAAEPTWSPDGSRIAFAGAVSEGDDTDIFVMEPDGSGVRLLARTNRLDRRPDWSPDGSRIVFDTYGKIWVASVADGHVTQIPISTPQGYPVAPIWSPNGRWIAVTGYDAHTINGIVHIIRLWLVRPDGTGRRALEKGKPNFYDSQLEASWSPKGSSIAFAGGKGRGSIDVIQTGDHRRPDREGALHPRSPSRDRSQLERQGLHPRERGGGRSSIPTDQGSYNLPFSGPLARPRVEPRPRRARSAMPRRASDRSRHADTAGIPRR